MFANALTLTLRAPQCGVALASLADGNKLYRAIDYFRQALRSDAGIAAHVLFNIAAVWGRGGHGLDKTESSSFCEAAALLVRAVEAESTAKASTQRHSFTPQGCTRIVRAQHASLGAQGVNAQRAVHYTDVARMYRYTNCTASGSQGRAAMPALGYCE